MSPHFDLTDLRLFLNIVDGGSITAGASATHLSLAACSERVAGMEQSLAAHSQGSAPVAGSTPPELAE